MSWAQAEEKGEVEMTSWPQEVQVPGVAVYVLCHCMPVMKKMKSTHPLNKILLNFPKYPVGLKSHADYGHLQDVAKVGLSLWHVLGSELHHWPTEIGTGPSACPLLLPTARSASGYSLWEHYMHDRRMECRWQVSARALPLPNGDRSLHCEMPGSILPRELSPLHQNSSRVLPLGSVGSGFTIGLAGSMRVCTATPQKSHPPTAGRAWKWLGNGMLYFPGLGSLLPPSRGAEWRCCTAHSSFVVARHP